MKKPASRYELEWKSFDYEWELLKTYSATAEKQARREFEARNRNYPGEYRLYRVERKMLKARKVK